MHLFQCLQLLVIMCHMFNSVPLIHFVCVYKVCIQLNRKKLMAFISYMIPCRLIIYLFIAL